MILTNTAQYFYLSSQFSCFEYLSLTWRRLEESNKILCQLVCWDPLTGFTFINFWYPPISLMLVVRCDILSNFLLQVFDSCKRFICIIDVDYPLNRPSGICLTRNDHLFVLNYWDNSLAKYHLTYKFI